MFFFVIFVFFDVRVYSGYNMYMAERKQRRSPEHFNELATQAIKRYDACFMRFGIRSCVYNVSLYNDVFPVSKTRLKRCLNERVIA